MYFVAKYDHIFEEICQVFFGKTEKSLLFTGQCHDAGVKKVFKKMSCANSTKITIESVDWNRFSIHLLCNFTTTILRIDLLTPVSFYYANVLYCV